MQAGLRPYVQDENALAGLHRAGGVKGGGLGGLGGEAGGAKALAKGTPGFPAVRKALGNITNRGGGLDAENAPPGKTPAAGAAPRRALGDITNSSAAGSVQRQQLKAPTAGLAPQQAVQPPAAVAAAAPAPASRADGLAEGGAERCFGRGWQQLERDRLAREDEESSRRLAALAAYPGRGLPNFFPLWVSEETGWQMCIWLAAHLPVMLVGLQDHPAWPACSAHCLSPCRPPRCRERRA